MVADSDDSITEENSSSEEEEEQVPLAKKEQEEEAKKEAAKKAEEEERKKLAPDWGRKRIGLKGSVHVMFAISAAFRVHLVITELNLPRKC